MTEPANLPRPSPALRPSPAVVAYIRQTRAGIRQEAGGGGQCHEVADWIAHEFGWPRHSGAYTDRHDDPICDAHVWNILPDGAILDGTADQFGAGHDVRVIAPSDPEHARYRSEWYEDYYPGHPSFPAISGRTWSGEFDAARMERLRRVRGDGWWIQDVAAYETFRARDYRDASAIYRWVDDRGALAYLRANAMIGRWRHFLPANVTDLAHSKFQTGVSFSQNAQKWSTAGNVCFVVDRQRLDVASYDINGQAVYLLSDMMGLIKAGMGVVVTRDQYDACRRNAVLESLSDPDEVFVVPAVRELSSKLLTVMYRDVVPKTVQALAAYCAAHGIPLINLGSAETRRYGREIVATPGPDAFAPEP